MSAGGPLPPGEGEPLVRPFLRRGSTWPGPGPVPPSAPGASSSGGVRGEVRPYLMTGGRTSAAPHANIAMETVVVMSGAVRAGRPDRTAFERAAVLAECERPSSVAEIAARLRLPLVVALVIVGDLVADGLIEASTTTARQADDIAFLERLIHGVTAL